MGCVVSPVAHYSRWSSKPRHATTAASVFTPVTAKNLCAATRRCSPSSQAMQCQLMKRRNLTTKWTVHYRRINKKGSIEEAEKRRRAKKTTVKTREIVGLSEEMLAKKRAARPAQKDKQKDAVLAHLKSRKGAKKK